MILKSARVLWKTLAIILCVLSFCTSLLSAAFIYVGARLDFYTSPKQQIIDDALSGHLDMKCEDLIYILETRDISAAIEHFKYDNFAFELYDMSGNRAYSTYDGEGYIVSKSVKLFDESVYYNVKDEAETVITTGKLELSSATCYIPQNLYWSDEIQSVYKFINAGFDLRFIAPVVCLISLLVTLLSFVFLMCVAGRRPDTDKIVFSPFDKLPFDLFCILFLIFGLIEAGFINYYTGNALISLALLSPLNLLALIFFFTSLATRLKKGGLIKTTLCFMMLKAVFTALKGLFSKAILFIRSMTFHWKCTLFFAIAFLSLFLVYVTFGDEAALTVSIVALFALMCITLRILQDYTEIKRGVERIQSGDIYHKIPSGRMLPSCKLIAERINSIQENLQKVVETSVKSERFKTELITNVSHDLKTPLTSIVNYVDLIAKQPIENETLREYVEVLERQALRLKKLTEDLIEASKASSGSIEIEYAPCDLAELLSQTFGEYSERLEAVNLTLCASLPETPVIILADGKRLWRILDNVFSNVVKYALPSTRVWVSLTEADKRAVVTFKNVSREIINMTGAELTERFVRADTSRNSEGSGLGLSIAKSLTELQNGSFTVSVDADLFKVEISFPIID